MLQIGGAFSESETRFGLSAASTPERFQIPKSHQLYGTKTARSLYKAFKPKGLAKASVFFKGLGWDSFHKKEPPPKVHPFDPRSRADMTGAGGWVVRPSGAASAVQETSAQPHLAALHLTTRPKHTAFEPYPRPPPLRPQTSRATGPAARRSPRRPARAMQGARRGLRSSAGLAHAPRAPRAAEEGSGAPRAVRCPGLRSGQKPSKL